MRQNGDCLAREQKLNRVARHRDDSDEVPGIAGIQSDVKLKNMINWKHSALPD